VDSVGFAAATLLNPSANADTITIHYPLFPIHFVLVALRRLFLRLFLKLLAVGMDRQIVSGSDKMNKSGS